MTIIVFIGWTNILILVNENAETGQIRFSSVR